MPTLTAAQPRLRLFPAARRLCAGLAALLGCLRFVHLRADFPNFSPWSIDQAKYTDEGWWASAAVRHTLLGHWTLPGDYNPAVAVPVWPVTLDLLFRFTGVSLIAARALSVCFSLATLALLWLLIRRYANHSAGWAPATAVLLLASSPFAFVYSRLAILDTFVVFQFCLLLFIASCAGERRGAALVSLAILCPAIVLTKTTAVVLLPAVAWLTWMAMKGVTLRTRLASLAMVGITSALLVRGYVAWIFFRGHEVDYREFYDANSLDPIDWSHTFGTLRDIAVSCMWTGRILFPLAAILVVVSLIWLRRVWENPLARAAILAIGGQVTFLFATQGSYAPRYFLPMLVPLILLISLTLEAASARLGSSLASTACLLPAGVIVALNLGTLFGYVAHPTFQFDQAAESIQRIVRSDSSLSPLVVGVSAADLSLMTRLPSLSDVYGTESLAERVADYKPGWYLAWNRVGPGELAALAGYRLERVASYPAFDDDERNELILFRLVAVKQ